MHQIEKLLIQNFKFYIENFDFSKLKFQQIADDQCNLDFLFFEDSNDYISGFITFADNGSITSCGIKFKKDIFDKVFSICSDFIHRDVLNNNGRIVFSCGMELIGKNTLAITDSQIENDDLENLTMTFIDKLISSLPKNRERLFFDKLVSSLESKLLEL